MSDINWNEESVCRAMMMQWKEYSNSKLISDHDTILPYDGIYDIKDFQLNEIRVGDFIPASELDTEQKYNDIVEVFGLFGAEDAIGYKGFTLEFCNLLLNDESIIVAASNDAIGKLKRMMLERAIPAVEFGVVEDELIDHQTLGNRVTTNKYEREIIDRQGNSAMIDVYDVIIAYGVTCPATQHAIKKLLCTGDRGHKDTLTDLSEARDAITRAIELN